MFSPKRIQDKKAQDYGMDDITEEKIAAWIRFGENMMSSIP
jgi:hypothetical protein